MVGCYWGAPYETHIFDFTNPKQPPYRRLARVADDDSRSTKNFFRGDSYVSEYDLSKISRFSNLEFRILFSNMFLLGTVDTLDNAKIRIEGIDMEYMSNYFYNEVIYSKDTNTLSTVRYLP